MHEVTIITAFFDIGRVKWKTAARDNNAYVKYFRFWARIRNKLIVYTESTMKDIVMDIRNEYGLGDLTEVVVVDDIKMIDNSVFEAMKKALDNPLAIEYRLEPQNPESYNAVYNYVMYLKPLLIENAIKEHNVSGMIAWVDFGFNHGGDYYIDTTDFDFCWQTEENDKIHLFSMNELDDTPIFEIVRNMKVYISGAMILAPMEAWIKLKELYRNAVISLSDCGFSDDDQTVALMAYRKEPELFSIHKTKGFFDGLELMSNQKFSIKKEKEYKIAKKQYRKALKNKEFGLALKKYFKYVELKMQRR